MPDYWIKLYHEMLDDPKTAILPDRLWRRLVELFLLSGRLYTDKSGKLPDTKQIAWALRMPIDDMENEMKQLSDTGMIETMGGGWIITNFEKRQGPASGKERVDHHRERKHTDQYNGLPSYNNNGGNENETEMKRDCNETLHRAEQKQSRNRTEHNISSSSEFSDPKLGDACTLYDQAIGGITGFIAGEIKDAIDQHGYDFVVEAIKASGRNGGRTWAYVDKAIKGRAADGRNPKPVQKNKPEYTGEINIPNLFKEVAA